MSVQNEVNTVASVPQTRSASGMTKLVALAMGFIMATLDATVVNVAGANIQEKLAMSMSSLTWIVDGYVLTFASLLLLAGSLANRFGAKKVYLWGMVLFIAASLVCGLSQSGDVLIVARLIQGAGAALFMPSSLSLLMGAFPDEKERAKMVGLWSAIVSTASGLGPFIGGVLVNSMGWRSIFMINLPIGIIGFIMTTRAIAPSKGNPIKVSLTSHLLGIITLAALCFALIEGSNYGWGSTPIIASFIVTVLAAAMFVARERKVQAPIIPTALFRDARFSAANMVGFLLNFALFGGMFMLGLFLQKARGASPFMAGVELLPMMIVFVIGNLLFARIVGKTGTRIPLIVALTVAGIGALILITVSPAMPYWVLAIVMAIANLGVGVTVPAMTASLMQAAGRENANMAGATLNANRQVGALVGTAIMGLVITTSSEWYRGASLSFTIMAIAYLLAAFLSWRFIRTKPAA